MISQTERSGHRAQNFVNFIIKQISGNRGVAAALRRADNPATEYQSWEQLAAFHIDLDKTGERLPHAIIAAAIAKAKLTSNGNLGIGRALAKCYAGGKNNDQAKAKLRRLLACDSTSEVCRILRPILSLIRARNARDLDFTQLLSDLLAYRWDDGRECVKARWAQDFYRVSAEEIKDVEEASC